MESCRFFSTPTFPLLPTLTKPNLSLSTALRVPSPTFRRALPDDLREEAETILEWPYVCEQVSRFTSTRSGRELCLNGGLRVGRSQDESRRLLDQTAAVVALPEKLDFEGVEDVTAVVRAAVSGEVLGVREICSVERSLRAARSVYEQLKRLGSGEESGRRYTPLFELFRNCSFMTELVQEIRFCIDSNLSMILDQASPKLESVRSERRKNMDNLELLLKNISSKIFQSGGIDSPLITKRRSRMCVGIRASHKFMLPDGILLGSSSSGTTYFMEPRDVVELNNMEVRLSNSEKIEEFAILCNLTSKIASSESKTVYLMERIHELDLASARGAHALWMSSLRPIFSETTAKQEDKDVLLVDIEGIYHPLLLEPSLKNSSITSLSQSGNVVDFSAKNLSAHSHRIAKPERIVPVDIKIKKMSKVVVISGPNTGGKTVAMKTLGLASLMSKAGMFLPARDHPKLPWFDQVLADIGDQQSLEQNLSTFSGHISCLCKILNVASEKSLVLIDEIGNGTDPSEGVALSISILQHLVNRVGLAVVTTHYADLSLLKDDDFRFENAAMEFCLKALKPTYQILWGCTGNSNALKIAKSIGFDQEVLARAEDWVEKLLPDKQKERQGLLYQSLLEERNKLERQAKKAECLLLEAKKLHFEIHSEAEDLDRREEALKSKETKKINDEIKVIRSQMDMVIKSFEKQLESSSVEQYTTLSRQAESSITKIVEAQCSTEELSLKETSRRTAYTLQVGDQVRVRRLGNKLATVVEAAGDDGKVLVQYGNIRIHVKRNDIELDRSTSSENSAKKIVERKKEQLRRKDLKQLTIEEVNDVQEAPYGAVVQTSKNTVDLRGMRVEEASNYLNLAISGCRSRRVLFVVHGIGTGAVKECVLGVLRKHPRVAKFEEESPMNYGCTVVYIK